MIKVNNIRIRYDQTEALRGVSFEVSKGEIFGLIGPDGSGKTSLIRILTTLLLPDEGWANVSGMDVVQHFKKLRKMIGYMPGRFSLYEDLTVEENLELFASIFGTTIEKNYELIKDIYVQIEPFRKRKAGKLSGGMKQKLALSCAMIHKPEVVFLDEPTTGVDPVSRKEFWGMLKKLAKSGITILVSTPYMDEAKMCDRIGLIQNGKLLDIDTPQNIIEKSGEILLAISSSKKHQLIEDMRAFESARSVFLFGEFIHYSDINKNPDTGLIENYLRSKGHEEVTIMKIKPTIEDRFMALMSTNETP